MRGVSEIIAIILILMITIAIAGLAYTFMSSTMASTTSAASSAVTETSSSMLTSFIIDSMDVARIYVRNTGQTSLTNFSVYVNDEPAAYNITPSSLSSGQVGTITIYSFIPDGATVKVTSPSGFSASKVAVPCSKALRCWNFDESSGSTAYDSSPYGGSGTLANGAIWTSGIYGNGIRLDGINDYFNAMNSTILNFVGNQPFSISFWFYMPTNVTPRTNWPRLVDRERYSPTRDGWQVYLHRDRNEINFQRYSNGVGGPIIAFPVSFNIWYYFVGVYNGTHVFGYMNGSPSSIISDASAIPEFNGNLTIGSLSPSAVDCFNGTIDEFRIYDKPIY